MGKNKKQAIADHKAAKRDLEQVSKRDGHESDDYLAANKHVAETEKNVSWWRR